MSFLRVFEALVIKKTILIDWCLMSRSFVGTISCVLRQLQLVILVVDL